ncbi:hypothetical protein [Nocardia blacklockiae]|uniref:hypothetical protein n=1 Tax=Nocardia blacklockiae TaxID=480036 RepID=UPI00189637E7|nr:hypothetical protein [Nocardia blacklockiae]MBF6173986.1 hypothetical protein [Nocardia blacklockiae]
MFVRNPGLRQHFPHQFPTQTRVLRRPRSTLHPSVGGRPTTHLAATAHTTRLATANHTTRFITTAHTARIVTTDRTTRFATTRPTARHAATAHTGKNGGEQ